LIEKGMMMISSGKWLVGLILPAFLGMACEEPPEPEAIRPVRAIKLGDASAFEGRWFPGRAKATQEANLAFEVSGTVVERVDVGDKVTEGTLLSRLDPRDFKNALDRAAAERDRASAHLDRIRTAEASGAVSKQDLTDAEARYNQASATVKIRQKALDDTHIFAPFTGTVAATYVEKHEAVQPKQVILRLLDAQKIEMVIDVPESRIGNAPYVKELRIRFDTVPGREFPAEIKEISNEASQTTRTYPVTLIMDAPTDVTIQPGMAGEATARLELPEDKDLSGYEVPLSAIFSEKDQTSYVWVIDEGSGQVSLRPVELGNLTPRGVLIKSGIKSGEWVATAGVHFLRDGQEVRILE
jgi:RND family efflux transporter MFP subunit